MLNHFTTWLFSHPYHICFLALFMFPLNELIVPNVKAFVNPKKKFTKALIQLSGIVFFSLVSYYLIKKVMTLYPNQNLSDLLMRYYLGLALLPFLFIVIVVFFDPTSKLGKVFVATIKLYRQVTYTTVVGPTIIFLSTLYVFKNSLGALFDKQRGIEFMKTRSQWLADGSEPAIIKLMDSDVIFVAWEDVHRRVSVLCMPYIYTQYMFFLARLNWTAGFRFPKDKKTA